MRRLFMKITKIIDVFILTAVAAACASQTTVADKGAAADALAELAAPNDTELQDSFQEVPFDSIALSDALPDQAALCSQNEQCPAPPDPCHIAACQIGVGCVVLVAAVSSS